MPELPEVETTLRGLKPHLLGRRIVDIQVTQPRLRWPIPDDIHRLVGGTISSLPRRAKFLVVDTNRGHMIWHLGMSGSLRILPNHVPAVKHEHVTILFDDDSSLRYRDPRRFGCLLFAQQAPFEHQLFTRLGPEPLSDVFTADYLSRQCRTRSSAIKTIIMDSHVVVGIGNIYACESLFLSGINPKTRANRIRAKRIQRLVNAIKSVLAQAIEKGGTTLQDFTQADGKPGYFRHSLQVYGNTGQCPKCGRAIHRITQAQRSTFYCTNCQR